MINLASRRFGNERLPTLGVALLAAATLAGTAWHAHVAASLAGGRGSATREAVGRMQSELQDLRGEAEALRGPAPGREDVAKWLQLAELVDRRAFSWTLLLSRLEGAISWDVRLTQILPSTGERTPTLSLTAVAQSTAAALSQIERLESLPEFEDVEPNTLTDVDGEVLVGYSLRYDPAAVPSDDAEEGHEASPTGDSGS